MRPPRRLIIVADDLAGAADCGVVFAARGLRTRVVFDAEPLDRTGWSVIALDTDTRDAAPELAERRVRDAMALVSPDELVFKKVDSTLRGNLAVELRAAANQRDAGCIVAAPAFPATGRTTRGGRQLIDGRPLEDSEFAAQVSTSVLRDLLAPAGLRVREVSLAQLRGGGLPDLVSDAEPGEVLICDAETEDDLDAVGRGGIAGGRDVTWMGTAGLARRLAGLLPLGPGSDTASSERSDGPLLLVVGSPAAATRAQLRRLHGEPDLVEVCAAGVDLATASAAVRDALRCGCDCVLTLGGDADEAGERDAGRAGTETLAAVAAAAAEAAGGLVLTGGETARAVLGAISARALTLERELEPGIALAHTDAPASLAVALKAGGFGGDDALVACRSAMKQEQEEQP